MGAWQGMLDPQLEHLARVLRNGRIWALNVGENFQITLPAWQRFTDALAGTAVAYLYVSEHHLGGTNIKISMRDAIRINRKCAPPLLHVRPPQQEIGLVSVIRSSQAQLANDISCLAHISGIAFYLLGNPGSSLYWGVPRAVSAAEQRGKEGKH